MIKFKESARFRGKLAEDKTRAGGARERGRGIEDERGAKAGPAASHGGLRRP
jgi:hypothetical protein